MFSSLHFDFTFTFSGKIVYTLSRYPVLSYPGQGKIHKQKVNSSGLGDKVCKERNSIQNIFVPPGHPGTRQRWKGLCFQDNPNDCNIVQPPRDWHPSINWFTHNTPSVILHNWLTPPHDTTPHVIGPYVCQSALPTRVPIVGTPNCWQLEWFHVHG